MQGRHRVRSPFRWFLPILVLGSLIGACNTKAVGIQECRDVEYARCTASVPCGVVEKGDVEACQRFYRDQCLHGISGPEVPTADEHQTCVDLIVNAGVDALQSLIDDPEGEPDETACRIVAAPWRRPECDYLNPEPKGAGGAPKDESE